MLLVRGFGGVEDEETEAIFRVVSVDFVDVSDKLVEVVF